MNWMQTLDGISKRIISEHNNSMRQRRCDRDDTLIQTTSKAFKSSASELKAVLICWNFLLLLFSQQLVRINRIRYVLKIPDTLSAYQNEMNRLGNSIEFILIMQLINKFLDQVSPSIFPQQFAWSTFFFILPVHQKTENTFNDFPSFLYKWKVHHFHSAH